MKLRRRPAMITLVALVIGSRPALAASWFNDDLTALPCRPTIACTADIVPPGSFELEIGYLFRKLRSPLLQHSVPFLAKLTLAEWVQLQVGGAPRRATPAPALGRAGAFSGIASSFHRDGRKLLLR